MNKSKIKYTIIFLLLFSGCFAFTFHLKSKNIAKQEVSGINFNNLTTTSIESQTEESSSLKKEEEGTHIKEAKTAVRSSVINKVTNKTSKLNKVIDNVEHSNKIESKDDPSSIKLQVEENSALDVPKKKKMSIKDKIKDIWAYKVTDFSDDKNILNALNLLVVYGHSDLLDKFGKYGVRIKFDNMAIVSYNAKNCHAATVNNNKNSNKIILINSRYRNLPPEEIACLIMHEATHLGRKNNLETEILAIKNEANCWSELKNSNKNYEDNKLTKRLDYLVDTINQPEEVLIQKITSNDFYKKHLLEL